MISRFGPRATTEPSLSREPMARSECPDTSGATSGSSPVSPVDRSTSVYATTSALEAIHAARSAPPRPLLVEARATSTHG